MDVDLYPKGVNAPIEEIIPEREEDVHLDGALDEIKPVVEELSEDVSGIGQKAAERYLLRYEYGMATSELAEEFDVASTTISNQVSTVRTKVLKFPRLARTVGTLRAHRSGLNQPDIEDGETWEGEVTLDDETIQYNAEFKSRNPGRPYSWCYLCESQYEFDTRIYHLFQDFLIDAVYGVFLKRSMWGFSRKSWKRPAMSDKYEYTVYPLPNAEIPNSRDGSLLDAAESHWAYGIKERLGPLVTKGPIEGDLETRAEHGDTAIKKSGYYARSDVLADRLSRSREPEKEIGDYTETVHIRNNIERLFRTYPFESPFDLPAETVTQVWNGQPTDRVSHDNTWLISKQPLYNLTTTATSRHRGRDVYVNGNMQSVKIPLWREKSQ